MSIVKSNKLAARNARIAKRKTITLLEKKISEAKALYKHERIEIAEAEHNAMNEMLSIVRYSDRPLTAKEIAARCHSDISKHEVAGNLVAMSDPYKCSRYWHNDWCCCYKISEVKIPHRDEGEEIEVESNRNKVATFVEVDENGNIIPGTQFTKTIELPNLYSIKDLNK